MTTETRDPSIGPATADAVDVRLAAGGDTRAFERIYRRHVARIQSLAGRMLGSEETTDVVQDIFVRAWERLPTFRGEAAFGTWLHRVAVNVILAYRGVLSRRQSRFVQADEALESHPARPTSPDLRMDFEAALRCLPSGAREIFVLHDVEGYKHQEIATLLGITAGTSKSQLHRARTMLRAHLTR